MTDSGNNKENIMEDSRKSKESIMEDSRKNKESIMEDSKKIKKIAVTGRKEPAKETEPKENKTRSVCAKKTGKKKTDYTKVVDKKTVTKILAKLDEQYGTDYVCYLNHENAWQLLIATILSAQCTDARVNIVTKDLFVKYPTVEAFANADVLEMEQDIHSTGFYHHKARNIIACCRMLLEKYNGEVPSSIEELTSLPGVGRKTANVIRGNIYHEPSVVVDTHVKRISRKLGLTVEDEPEKIEYELMKVLPKEHWILYNIQIITLGRSICKAQSPACQDCFLQDVCRGRKG